MSRLAKREKDLLVDDPQSPEDIYELFLQSRDLLDGLNYFYQLCESLHVNPQNHKTIYTLIKTNLNSWKCRNLWNRLDKKAKHVDYKNKPCSKLKVMVVGAGPCGLRVAIELAYLGAHVVVVEKRDAFSRNNVLHLWPFLITDLKSLGAKSFFGKFCAGSLDHISIRKLQLILLKVALLVGVQVFPQTGFVDLVEPSGGHGWRANLSPKTSPLHTFEFDAIIGADGKRNTLKGFKRKEFRGKLAIAVTCNFVNKNSQEEARVEEISGVAFIFNQQFFQKLKDQTGIDLENIVYYKDDTHYFVMTAKKASLLAKGVLRKDYSDIRQLLAPDNINHSSLLVYSREAADFSTDYQLPHHEFARNHYGKEDVALFDFTSIFAAENSSRIIERQNKRLLMGIVGDTLLEPFWPTGSGCARGFLGCFDVAWMIRGMGMNKHPLDLLQEREGIFKLLAQTKPDSLQKNHANYSIDPRTRYANLNLQMLKRDAVLAYYDCSSNPVNLDKDPPAVRPALRDMVSNIGDDDGVDAHVLLKWCKEHTRPYSRVVIADFGNSWKNGLGFCALLHRFRPNLIDMQSLTSSDALANCQLAFVVAEQQLGISPKMSASDFVNAESADRLALVSYVSQYYEAFKKETPAALKSPQLSKDRSAAKEAMKKSPASKMSILSRLSRRSKAKPDKKKSSSKLGRRSNETEHSVPEDSSVKLSSYRSGNEVLSDEKPLVIENATESEKPKKKFKLKKKSTAVKSPSPVVPSLPIPQAESPKEEPRRQRKQSRISQLAQDVFGVPIIQAAIKRDKKRMSESETCYFCKKHVYVMERMSAEGHFFHRKCFCCTECGCNLLLGNYAYVDDPDGDPGHFYCNIHYNKIIYATDKIEEEEPTVVDGQESPRGKRRPVTQMFDRRSLEEAFPELSPRLSPRASPHLTRNGADGTDEVDCPPMPGPDSPASPYRHLEARSVVRHPSLTMKSPQKVTVKQSVIEKPSLKHAVSTPALHKLFAEDKSLAENIIEQTKRQLPSNHLGVDAPQSMPAKKRLSPSKDLKEAVKSLMDKDKEWEANRPPTPGRPVLNNERVVNLLRDETDRDAQMSGRRMQYPESVALPDSFNVPGLKPLAIDINYEDKLNENDAGFDDDWGMQGKKKRKKYVLKKKKAKDIANDNKAATPSRPSARPTVEPPVERKAYRKPPVWKPKKYERESSLVENDEWVIVDKGKLPRNREVANGDDVDGRDDSYSSSDESEPEDQTQGGFFRRAFASRPKQKKGMSSKLTDESDERRQRRKERKQISMQMRQRHLKRLWQAQSIQRKLYEVEVRQNELDENATEVEKCMRHPLLSPVEEGKLMMDWLRLVNDKNILLRFESELVIQAKSIQLEDQQARLEQQIRDLLTADVVKLSHHAQIDALTKELVDTVEQRNSLVEMLEEDRLRELEEDRTLSKVLAKKAQELGMDRLI